MQVYQAQYLHCDVAVKKLNRINDKKSDEAFRREAAILKGCRNPYIVNFMGVCKDEVRREPCARCRGDVRPPCALMCLWESYVAPLCIACAGSAF